MACKSCERQQALVINIETNEQDAILAPAHNFSAKWFRNTPSGQSYYAGGNSEPFQVAAIDVRHLLSIHRMGTPLFEFIDTVESIEEKSSQLGKDNKKENATEEKIELEFTEKEEGGKDAEEVQKEEEKEEVKKTTKRSSSKRSKSKKS